MFVKLKEGKQGELIKESIKRAGSYRKLAKLINIPRSSLAGYIKKSLIHEDKLALILKFLEIKDKNNLIIDRFPDNWKQIKGGKKCVELKKKKGTFEIEMKKWQKLQAKKLKRWHKLMKKEKPEEYYRLQYSRFKKIGGYKFITKRGENVRNTLERDVANILHSLNINYEYEPLINIKNKYFFPDFVIDNKIVIECTMWKGAQKAHKLRDKINILNKKYKVFVVIPKSLYRYYETLDNHLSLLDEFVPVAQTFKAKA